MWRGVEICVEICIVSSMSASELLPEVLSVTEASARGISKLLSEAGEGAEFIVQRHHKPVAAIIGIERMSRIEELEADLQSAALVLARLATDSGNRTTLDEVIERFGFSRGQIDAELDRDIAAGRI